MDRKRYMDLLGFNEDQLDIFLRGVKYALIVIEDDILTEEGFDIFVRGMRFARALVVDKDQLAFRKRLMERYELTPREVEVFIWFHVKQDPSEVVARKLGISISTVRAHIREIHEKIGSSIDASDAPIKKNRESIRKIVGEYFASVGFGSDWIEFLAENSQLLTMRKSR